MKLALAVLVVILLLGGGWYFVAKNTPIPPPIEKTPITATTLQKSLFVQKAGAGAETEVETSATVYAGDTLHTLHTGRGLLASINGTQTLLDYDTELTIQEQDATGSKQSYELTFGSVWARVQKVLGQGEYYEIQTQNVVAAVRGTSFSVTYRDHVTTVVVVEGMVSLTPLDPLTHKRLTEKEVVVPAGSKATITDEGVITVTSLTQTDKKSEWYRFNMGIRQTPLSTTSVTAPTTSAPSLPTPIPVEPQVPVVKPLSLTSVSPTTVVSPKRVTLRGSGFSKLSELVVGGYNIPNRDITVESDVGLTFSTESVPAGVYSVTVIDTDQGTKTLARALTVEAPPQQQTPYNQKP
ncbi:MAG: FecR family protein [Patescibacteria group bacterium]|mgnify:CR=1